MALLSQKNLSLYVRLLQNCPQSPFRHVTGVIWHRRVSASVGVIPDFMTSRGLSIKRKPESLQPFNNITVPESG